MKRTAALTLGLILAAPALAIDMPPPAPIKSIEWLPATTVRIGQGINAAYRVTTQTGQSSEIWLNTDCQTGKNTLLFINAQAGKSLRVYSTDSIDRYTPATPFDADADSPFMTTPGLNLCKQNVPEPKWAGVTTGDQHGETLFIDLNNSLRKGAMLKARLATDFDKIYHDEKYGAPYSVKIQDVMLNCEKAEGATLITFALDDQGRVTDTATAKDATLTKLPPDMAGVAKTLCAVSDLSQYKGTGTLTWGNKEVADSAPAQPDLEHNTPAAAL